MNTLPANEADLIGEIRQLIDTTRQRVAVAVHGELTLLYWQIGRRIYDEILHGERAAYGQKIIQLLAEQLTLDYGRGWGTKQLRHCLRSAETIVDRVINQPLWPLLLGIRELCIFHPSSILITRHAGRE